MLLLRDDLPDFVLESHDAIRPTAHVSLVEITGVQLGAAGFFYADGQLRLVPEIFPPTVNALVGTGIGLTDFLREAFSLKPDELAVRHSDLPVIVSIHPLWIYGHFLLESVLRVIFLHNSCPPEWPIALCTDVPDWAVAILRLVAPGRAFFIYDSKTEIVSAPVFIGCNDLISGHSFDPRAQSIVAALKKRLLSQPATSPSPAFARLMKFESLKRIFVSRTLVKEGVRRVSRRKRVDIAMAEDGFAVVHPQLLTFVEQVRVFDKARLIVGEYGSGMLNSVFTRTGATVVSLNWVDPFQSCIAEAIGNHVAYITPETGRFVTADQLMFRGSASYEFSPQTVRSALQRVKREKVGLFGNIRKQSVGLTAG